MKKLTMTKAFMKRLTAFVLALVMCATAFMAAGGVNVKAEEQTVVLDGMVYPSGTIEKDVFHFTSGCQIHFIAGNENLVPSKQELMNSFSADALYTKDYFYASDVDATYIHNYRFVCFLTNRNEQFTTDSGVVTYKPSIFDVNRIPQRNLGEGKYFNMISANNNVDADLRRYDTFNGLSYIGLFPEASLNDVSFKVVVTFYSPACYFEVIDTWTIPFGSWTAEKAEAGQSCEEYLK